MSDSEKVIAAGATIINIPDTVGYAVPWEYAEFLKKIVEGTPISTRWFFPSTAITIWDSRWPIPWPPSAWAPQVEVTINGIGERAGNASLEELVMALNVRQRQPPLFHRHQHAPDLEHLPSGGRIPSVFPFHGTSQLPAKTRLPTSRASIRTACSRNEKPTRS